MNFLGNSHPIDGKKKELFELETVVKFLPILVLVLAAAVTGMLFLTFEQNSTGASIETQFSLSPSIGLTFEGELALKNPEGISGHWEGKGGPTGNRFSPVEYVGIVKYTFIPDNKAIVPSNVYAIVFNLEAIVFYNMSTLITMVFIIFISYILFQKKDIRHIIKP